VNNIFDDKLENLDQFNKIHKTIIKSNYKDIGFYSSLKCFENEFSENSIKNYTKCYNFIYNTENIPINFNENNRKRIDKDNKLIVLKRKNLYKKYDLFKKWSVIQNNILKNFINFYQKKNDHKLYFIFRLENK